MPKKSQSNDRRREEKGRFLVCDATGDLRQPLSGEKWPLSPIQCFAKAVDEHPQYIIVHFGSTTIHERLILLDLCAAVKRNRQTRRCLILGLLHSKHRQLVEDLERRNVDYIYFTGGAELDPTRVRHIIDSLGPDQRLDRLLSVLCPFLHYERIDEHHELTTCGAYQNRMVLGGRRLHEICETENHLRCEYFRKPWRKS